MLRGVHRYDNDPDLFVYTFLKNKKHGAATGSNVKEKYEPKKATRSPKCRRVNGFCPLVGSPLPRAKK